jgi:2-hydroxy-3-oxopropionate reductase
VLFRENGVAAGAANKVVIDMSSISPTATKAFAARRSTRKAPQYLDARCPAVKSAPRRRP